MGNEIILTLIAISIGISLFSMRLGMVCILLFLFLIPNKLVYAMVFGRKFDLDVIIFMICLLGFGKELLKGKHNLKRIPPLFKPFLIYSLISLLLIALAYTMPIPLSLSLFIKSTLKIIVIPYIAFFVLKSKRDIDLMLKVITICSCIMGGYALICFYLGFNPYILLIANLFPSDNQIWYENFSADDRLGFLLGRQQSTISHPQTWVGIIGLLLFVQMFIIHIKRLSRDNYGSNVVVFIILFINLFIGGSRSGMIAFLAALAFFILFFTSVKFKFKASIVTIVMIYLFSIWFVIDDMFLRMFESVIYVFDESKQMRGSSGNMRLSQLEGAFQIIKDCYVFGMGSGWVGNYIGQYGQHPILLVFESAIFYKLIDGGLVGLFLWFWFIYKLCRKSYSIVQRRTKDRILQGIITSFIICYFIFLIACGNWFAETIFYVLLVILIKYVTVNYSLMHTKGNISAIPSLSSIMPS